MTEVHMRLKTLEIYKGTGTNADQPNSNLPRKDKNPPKPTAAARPPPLETVQESDRPRKPLPPPFPLLK